MMLSFAVILVLAGCAHAMPADVEKRDGEGDVGTGVLQPPVEVLPEPVEKRDIENIGQPLIQKPNQLLPDPDAARKKRGYYYYYYYSYSMPESEPNLVQVTAKPFVPGEIIDYAADGGTGKAPGCLPEFEEMPQPNTMCVFDDEPTVSEYGIHPDDIDMIVDMHNEYRAQEPADDMTKMYWDDDIAVIAQKLAQSCFKGHDENYNRLVPGWNIPIGQNWCGGVKTWGKCLELWHNEKTVWKYGKKAKGMIGHFTQMVNTKAVAIGCGYAKCPNQHGQNMVCNYAFGQTAKDLKTPYTQGNTCDSCPGFCVNNLCDCGEKVCKNNGKLNKATCECQCAKPYDGDICEEINCSKKDLKVCGTKMYVSKNCKKYSNLPGMCPVECGLCPAA